MTEEAILESVTEKEIIDLVQTNGQIQTRAYQYKIVLDAIERTVTVLAPNGTAAKAGVQQQFPSTSPIFVGMSDIIMQVNDHVVIES